VHDNGQIGVGGNAPDLVVADNEISFNDYAGFCTCWEAGGGKWSRARHLVVRDNNVHDNIGPGLWTDTDNIDVLYAHNVVRRNTGVGIFHETSFDAVIRDNVVTGNGRAWTGWLDGAGILINSSPNIQIYGNTVLNNKDGIGITQWDRGSSPTLGPHQVHDISVHDNTTSPTTRVETSASIGTRIGWAATSTISCGKEQPPSDTAQSPQANGEPPGWIGTDTSPPFADTEGASTKQATMCQRLSRPTKSAVRLVRRAARPTQARPQGSRYLPAQERSGH